MKKFILLATLQVLFHFFAYGQSISAKNWTLIHELTADWCSKCGTWGWTFKDNVFREFEKDNVIFVANHFSGGLSNPDAQAFAQNFRGNAQPIFYVDGVNINVTSDNGSSKLSDTRDEVDYKKDVSVFAGIGIEAKYNENTKQTNVKAKIEFLSEFESGNFYFGLYLLEDVMHPQASRNGLQLHKNVLRKSLLPKVFENLIILNGVGQGEVFEFEADTDLLNGDRLKDYKLLGVVWTKVDDRFLFFNCNVEQPTLLSSTSDTEDIMMHAFQNENGDVIIHYDPTWDDKFTLEVTDIMGKVVYKNNHTNDSGKITIAPKITPGIHIITIWNNEQNKFSKKMYLH